MARFLSAEWLDQLSRPEAAGPGAPELVVEVVAAGAPEGDITYRVAFGGGRAWALPAGSTTPAQVRFTSDYATLAEIASGRLSAYDALSAGRARASGQAGLLVAHLASLANGDLLPAQVRATTTF